MSSSDRDSKPDNLIKPERRHLSTLRARLKELDRRALQGGVRTFDHAEMAALRVALDMLAMWFAIDAAPELRTSALLREAAQALAATGQERLAGRLIARAELLERGAECP